MLGVGTEMFLGMEPKSFFESRPPPEKQFVPPSRKKRHCDSLCWEKRHLTDCATKNKGVLTKYVISGGNVNWKTNMYFTEMKL